MGTRWDGQRLWDSVAPWLAIWDDLSERIKDDANNKNHRFLVAAALNKRVSQGPFPFWGCPASGACETLLPRSQWQQPLLDLREFRLTDKRTPGPQSPWKLFTAGSVGSQALVGIPKLSVLVRDPRLRSFSKVWPFETGPVAPQTKLGEPIVIHAEIYPSLLKAIPQPGQVNDSGQVRALASHFFHLDLNGRLAALFGAPGEVAAGSRCCVEQEDGWILGVC